MVFNSKKMKALGVGIMVTVAVGILGGCGSQKDSAEKGELKVGIVQLAEHSALDAANKGFIDGLAAKGYQEGKNIILDKQNAQADQSNLQNIAHRFVNNKVDLICAIATPAVQTMANATSDIPIVATAVTDYKAAKLVKDNTKPGTNVTGTTDMNPVAEQLDLLLKIIPDVKTVGVIYSSSEVNSQLQVEVLKQAAASKGIKIKESTVSNVNDIQQAARSLLDDVQAIYVPTDNVLASAIPTLVSITKEAKLPVICGEGGMVKVGGLATLGIDYYKLGVQTGEMAADILSGKIKPSEMPIQAQKNFTVMVNKKYADAIGIAVPEDIMKEAQIVE